MASKFLRQVLQVFNDDKYLPLFAGLASGLYPWAFYLSNNFDFVNSWSHFWVFAIWFVGMPTISYYLFYFLMRKKHLQLYKFMLLPLLNALVFFSLAMVALFATVGYKKITLIIVLSIATALLSWRFKKLFPKLLVIQFLLVLTTAYNFGAIAKDYLRYDKNWLDQPDAIESAEFQKKPNVYVIQPDGYVNFSELGKGYYNFDNSKFEGWLKDKGFVLYEDYRSNYHSTLTSNSALFGMKHHYYTLFDERKAIMDENPVVRIFNKNDYTTHFFAEVPYLITNRPNVSFDYMNFDLNEIPYLSKGLDSHRVILEDFPQVQEKQEGSNFYFFEKLLPGHITTFKNKNATVEAGREGYLRNLKHANDWLQKLITEIESRDPNALIILVADHGGYVGFEYTMQSKTKTDDRDLLYSAFSSALAIKWPDNKDPKLEEHLKSSVNLFRVLISYLAEDASYLEHKQEDASFNLIDKGAPRGCYKTLDTNGKVIFEPEYEY